MLQQGNKMKKKKNNIQNVERNEKLVVHVFIYLAHLFVKIFILFI